jgi:hypothetical protein
MAVQEIRRYSYRTPAGWLEVYDRINVSEEIPYQTDDGQDRVRYEGTWLGHWLIGTLPIILTVNGADTDVVDTVDGVFIPTPPGQQNERPRIGYRIA